MHVYAGQSKEAGIIAVMSFMREGDAGRTVIGHYGFG